MENKKKSVWDDIARVWKRVAAVIAAMGALTTFFVNVFGTPLDKTTTIAGILGLTILLISFYVDKQTNYIREEIEESKKDEESKLLKHTEESNRIISDISSSLDDLKKLSLDTRKDTLRIQLLMVMKDQPENKDTILKLAETYFVKLKGDWYMTSEFRKWAKSQNVELPESIFNQLNSNTEDS